MIIDRRPDEGDIDVSISTPFRFGIRDADSRADLASMYCAMTCAKAVFVPAEDLPSTDSGLAGADVVLSTFDDASGVVAPNTPCDQVLPMPVVADTTVYRIEKTTDGPVQEGVLYLTMSAQSPTQPYSFKVTLAAPSVFPTVSDYLLYEDYVGVVVGFVYWPESTGLFLFFREGGDGTKYITIAGPASDGVGTREVYATVDMTAAGLDWASAVTYTIYWDPTEFRRIAQVYAAGSDNVEVLLAEVSLDDLDPFLLTVRMGQLYMEDTPATKVTALVGLDGTEMGNYIDIYGIEFANFGRVLAYGGSQTATSTLDVLPNALIELVGIDGADEWRSEGTFTEDVNTETLHMAATTTTETGPARHFRTEPDLSRGEWMLVGKIAALNSVHEGVYTTGIGVSVEDGTRKFSLLLLDDFARTTMGIADAGAVEDDTLIDYRLPADDIDWSSEVPFLLVGSATSNTLRTYITTDDTAVIDSAYSSAGYEASAETAVSFGFVGTGDFSGDIYLAYLWVFPNCTFYEPVNADMPEAADVPWTRTTNDIGTRTLDATFKVDCTTQGAYDIYSITDATYDDTSGGVILFKATVTDWTDSDGADSPTRSEFGPIAAVRTTTVAAQVYFVRTDDSTTYVFLSNEASDYQDVLAQNSAGLAICAEIDPSVAHVYMLDVRPFQHVRLYLDYATTPAIDIPWPSSGALRELPAYMPDDAVVAFGSLGEDSGVACEFAFVRCSIGRGYDFKVSNTLDEDTLTASVYGSRLSVVIDVLDED